ncbi:MAG: hypothetical protein NVSMB62_24120 [Acidobacteriaceae bacterium]
MLDESEVGVSFRSAESVVDVSGGEADTECVAWSAVFGVEQKEKGNGVCAS